jgi:chaperonin GroES
MKTQPMHDRVVVKRVDSDQVSPGGIIIPDAAKEKPVRGRIIAVGPGKRYENGDLFPLTVKEGDLVLFNKYGGTEIKIDGEDLLIMREDDILGVLV